MFLVEFEQSLAASLFHFVFDLPLHTSCGCPLARRETEDMGFGELQFASKLVSLFKVVVALAGEAGDNVGADSDTWNEPFGGSDDGGIARAVIAAGHAAQDRIRAALHRQVEMAAHARIF